MVRERRRDAHAGARLNADLEPPPNEFRVRDDVRLRVSGSGFVAGFACLALRSGFDPNPDPNPNPNPKPHPNPNPNPYPYPNASPNPYPNALTLTRMLTSDTVMTASTRCSTTGQVLLPSTVLSPSATVAGWPGRCPDISPAFLDVAASRAFSGSAATILIFGFRVFAATATPLIMPPPPMGTTMQSRCGTCSRNSSPKVPCPAMTSGSLLGWTK
mmetsp:Transcript_31659/g.100551  ORF Transcript_31659/g.100551 Transcript_31659/m.100551 type:complete len:215 (-) Transcript_31659:208-852(-)